MPAISAAAGMMAEGLVEMAMTRELRLKTPAPTMFLRRLSDDVRIDDEDGGDDDDDGGDGDSDAGGGEITWLFFPSAPATPSAASNPSHGRLPANERVQSAAVGDPAGVPDSSGPNTGTPTASHMRKRWPWRPVVPTGGATKNGRRGVATADGADTARVGRSNPSTAVDSQPITHKSDSDNLITLIFGQCWSTLPFLKENWNTINFERHGAGREGSRDENSP